MAKGKHWVCCVRHMPDCICVSCARDNYGESDVPCCDQHCILCEVGKKCPDYIKEDGCDV